MNSFAALCVILLLSPFTLAVNEKLRKGYEMTHASNSIDTRFNKEGKIACDGCVDFLNVNENTLINILLNSIPASCEDLCGQLGEKVAQIACTLLCLDVGIKDFIKELQSSDLDPVYLCGALDACKKNDCKGKCTEIVSAVSDPSKGPVRTKFNFKITLRALNNTGVGVTEVSWPCQQCKGGQNGVAVIVDGLNKGDTKVVDIELNTAEDDWLYPAGVYPVSVVTCGYDCVDEHGTIYDTGYTNFTISG